MNTEEKIKLFRDVRVATRALGRILDGGHNLEVRANAEILRHDCMDALGSLSYLAVALEAEIGTDNL